MGSLDPKKVQIRDELNQALEPGKGLDAIVQTEELRDIVASAIKESHVSGEREGEGAGGGVGRGGEWSRSSGSTSSSRR